MIDTISAMATSSSGGERKSSSASSSLPIGFFLSVLLPISIAVGVVLYRLDPFDPAPFPEHEFFQKAGAVAQPRRVNGRMMQEAEFVGDGQLRLPEDIVYDPSLGVLYTGCVDGWINRVTVNESASDSAVEKWVNTGGRPLGLALNHQNHELIVADAVKGLLKITKDKEVILLSDEAEGQKFGLTDGVDVAKDGTIYFTDASSKYGLENHLRDYYESRPYGRLLSFDPTTGLTKVLRRRLYFSNGVAVSPDQTSVIFCETPLKRCRRYRMEGGDGNGSIERFIDNLPGFPDNVHYDGEVHYWIAIFTSFPPYASKLMKYRLVRKIMKIAERHTGRLIDVLQKDGGAVAVDLEGNPSFHFYDSAALSITSGVKIADHLYLGSLSYQHIIRVNLARLSAS
ncbi:hypothetical protein Nepgr_013190 [Nepenthes gracilis]|uniref:Strictosidine synthase conserved region domain-containing protein n=1 Tax=Nepenthes gracilis TaxID=150966 RepID=A0AAD3SII2_NEPGR|nr:hypothetical protein Nepgr_013190 [Nepenthes gracilis]